MYTSYEAGPDPSFATKPAQPGWPRVVGAIGIGLGVLIFLDQVDDLWLQLTWTEEDWRRFFSPELAALMAAALRPTGWGLASTAIQMALGIWLAIGSLGLHRRRRSGVSLCRSWAWLAIAWVAFEISWAVRLLSAHADDIPGLSMVSWQAAAALGVGFALILLLAFPLFLLVWFARPEVREEYSSWPE